MACWGGCWRASRCCAAVRRWCGNATQRGATARRATRWWTPDADGRRDYRSIYDVSGDSDIIDLLVQRMAPGGEIVLAGFYSERIGFSFPPAFMREARIRIAAEWQEADLRATRDAIGRGELRLDGLVTHREAAERAPAAYAQAFTDPACLKMVLDWRDCT
jgi:3-hydroxyethyl bacteriochlorophyllide a dehydrogenase